MSWLNGPVVSLDTESTGVDTATDRVITACLGYSGRPGDWAPSEWLINPGVPIPAEATKVHGITDGQAAAGLDPRVALADIHLCLTETAAKQVPLVIFNAPYDLTLLDAEFRRHLGRALPDGLLVVDVLVLFRRFDFTTGNKRLEDLAYRNGIKFPAHNATADALAALRLLHILAADNDLLPLVPVADLQPLQAKWHAAHQEAAAAKRRGNGQSANDFNTDWPIRALAAQPLRAEPERTP